MHLVSFSVSVAVSVPFAIYSHLLLHDFGILRLLMLLHLLWLSCLCRGRCSLFVIINIIIIVVFNVLSSDIILYNYHGNSIIASTTTIACLSSKPTFIGNNLHCVRWKPSSLCPGADTNSDTDTGTQTRTRRHSPDRHAQRGQHSQHGQHRHGQQRQLGTRNYEHSDRGIKSWLCPEHENSWQIWPNTANTSANTDNTTRSTREPIQHGTTQQLAIRHAASQHDMDRQSPPLIYMHTYIYMYICT